jgi:translation initiation factor 1
MPRLLPTPPNSRERTEETDRNERRRAPPQRAGKTVIVIHGFATHLPLSVIETIAKKLRAGCGCGGTVRDRTIEMQGDQLERIRALLEGEGFAVAGVR